MEVIFFSLLSFSGVNNEAKVGMKSGVQLKKPPAVLQLHFCHNSYQLLLKENRAEKSPTDIDTTNLISDRPL